MKQNTLSNLILIAYLLMMIVSLVSAVDLFTLSHPSFAFGWIMSVAIEISIAALLIVNRKVPGIKSVLYVLGFITLFQICANTYSAYIHIENISPFAELFALDEWEVIDQKRMLAFATGGVLPAICLALIYIQNEVREQTETNKTDNKEPNDKAYNIEDVHIPSDEDASGEAEDASSPKSHIDQPISESESESEKAPTPQQQDKSTKDADINTESEEQAEIATEQLSETNGSNDQSEDTVESEAAIEKPKKRKYTKKNTSKSTSKTAKKTGKKTKTSKSNKKPKASKKAEEQTSVDEVSVTDVPESDPDSQSQESVAELAERLNDIRRGKHNPVSNGYSMML